MSETIRRMKDLPSTHLLGTGTPMCSGCGGLEALHQIYDVLGENTVFVNAAGCMTLLSVYPFTPFRGSWLYTAMGSAPAGAQGVRDALDILLQQGRLPPEDDLQVVVLTGDGSAYGMGMSATSGAMDRDLDFIYICYDNEGYGNTGQQYSSATPHGATTAQRHSPRRDHRHQLWQSRLPGVQEGPVLGVERAPAQLRGHGHRQRTPGPGEENREGPGHDRAENDYRPLTLSYRLGLRPKGFGVYR
jgi:pyruvate/2-oxoacid:ferredoxin oxidoreductase beta subunit